MGGLLPPGDLLRDGEGNVPQAHGPAAPLPGPTSSHKPSALGQGEVVGQGDKGPDISPDNSPDISPGLCLRTPRGQGWLCQQGKVRGTGGEFGAEKGQDWGSFVAGHVGDPWGPDLGTPTGLPEPCPHPLGCPRSPGCRRVQQGPRGAAGSPNPINNPSASSFRRAKPQNGHSVPYNHRLAVTRGAALWGHLTLSPWRVRGRGGH